MLHQNPADVAAAIIVMTLPVDRHRVSQREYGAESHHQ